MSTSLYRKYRPQTWADVAGQNHVKVALEFELATGRVAHAYLFSGPRGVGKTTVARLMAKSLNCTDRKDGAEACGACEACQAVAGGAALDVIELDAASHRGVEDVREAIVESARFAPARLQYKVFIIDEVHMLSDTAFNSLLKTIEEPPAKTVFILATTELHKVPATIVSRCQRFDFRKIPFTDLVERLHALAEREKCKVDKRTLEEIARLADGGLRDAEGLLGKVMAVGTGSRVSYDEALVVLPRSDHASLASFADALLHRDSRSALGTIGDCLENGLDLEEFASDAIELMRKVLLAKLVGDAGVFAPELDEERRTKITEWSGLAETSWLVRAIETLLEKRQDMKRAHPVQLPLELAVVRICEVISAKVQGDSVASAVSTPVKVAAKASEKVAAVKPAAAILESTGTTGTGSANAHVEEALESRLMDDDNNTSADTVPGDASQTVKMEAASTAFEEAALGDGHPPLLSGDGRPPVTSVSALKARWQELMNKASEENPTIPFLLGVGEPVEVSGERIVIGFDFAFHKDKMNEDRTRRGLEKALGLLLGAVVRVEGILLEKKRGIGHDDAASAGYAVQGATSGFQAAPVAADGLITAFGGRVVE